MSWYTAQQYFLFGCFFPSPHSAFIFSIGCFKYVDFHQYSFACRLVRCMRSCEWKIFVLSKWQSNKLFSFSVPTFPWSSCSLWWTGPSAAWFTPHHNRFVTLILYPPLHPQTRTSPEATPPQMDTIHRKGGGPPLTERYTGPSLDHTLVTLQSGSPFI